MGCRSSSQPLLERPAPDPAYAVAVSELGDGLDGLSTQELADRLVAIERVIRRAEAAVVAVLGEARQRGVWKADGHASLRGWASATVRWSPVQLRDRLRTMRLVADAPQVADVLAVGAVGVAQVVEMARVAANPRCGGEFRGEAAAEMLAEATARPFVEFRTLSRRWEELHDQDGAHQDHEAAHAGRRVTLSESAGTWWLHGQFGAAQGAVLAEILERFAQAEFAAEWAELRDRLGDDACAARMERTNPQRRADALYALAVQASGSATGAPAQPLVNIIIDEHTFTEALTNLTTTARPRRRRWAPPPPRVPTADQPDPAPTTSPPAWTPPGEPAAADRRCETTGGVVLDPRDVVAAALVGRVRRVVVDDTGVVINLGRKRRLFTGAAREAALVLGDRCLWPGCGRPHSQIDHTVAWARDGTTDQTNAAPLCPRHNRWKTRGYTTWRDPTGTWHTHRPDGTEITAA